MPGDRSFRDLLSLVFRLVVLLWGATSSRRDRGYRR